MISFNTYLIVYICIYLTSFALYIAIERINVHYLKKCGHKTPMAFEGIIDENELRKIGRYTVDNVRFKLFQTSISKIIFLYIILSGILPWLAQSLSRMNFLIAGLIFFAVIGLLEVLMGLPFDYYHSFVLEDKYGFNTKTLKIWLADLVKSMLVLIILGTFLLSAILLLVRHAGQSWWIWAWIIFSLFQLMMTILYPTVIAPLFNRFTSLEDSELKDRIQQLAKTEGLAIEGIYQMDASRRTRHTNAYFSGMGKAKRIVLFDSLIRSHGQDEILAILAHEIGHLKKNHIKKQFIIVSVVSLFLFFLAFKLLTWDVMYDSFGFSSMPCYVGLFLVGILWGPVNFFISPIGMAISRKFEREADFYSIEITKRAKPLSTALKKMAKKNLSNLKPHPLYVFFNYSHPPLLERIEYLEAHEMF
jgi:STE24 endopeptidase